MFNKIEAGDLRSTANETRQMRLASPQSRRFKACGKVRNWAPANLGTFHPLATPPFIFNE